jgi:chlorobactene glucosyltransferase
MLWIFWIILIPLIILTATVLFNSLFGPFLKRRHELKFHPRVSVLIPARNEEKNIATCLDHLLAQDYDSFEIIVLDDQSQDRTPAIVNDYARNHAHVILINGQTLPPGWTGKNWACHQLAQVAGGDIIIFTDADTQHGPAAIRNSLGWMQKYQLDMLSAFPQQFTKTFSEKLIVPVIDFFVYGLLPLWTTYFFKSAAFAAANGQWIVFKKTVYEQIGGHQSVKNEIVEDVELNRQAKRQGFKTLTLAGTKTVFCRMYHSAGEVWHGFTKNFYGLTGHRGRVFLLIELLLLGCCVLPYGLLLLNPQSFLLWIILSLNLLIRAVLAVRFKHPLIISVVLHPFAILYAAVIGMNSFYQFHWGYFQWKDRKIQFR